MYIYICTCNVCMYEYTYVLLVSLCICNNTRMFSYESDILGTLLLLLVEVMTTKASQ